MSSYEIYFSSEDATLVDGSEYTFVIPGGILDTDSTTDLYYRLVQFSCEQGYYATIRTGINDRIAGVYGPGDTPYTVTLAPGDYDVVRLVSYIVDRFASDGIATFTMDYDRALKMLYISDSDVDFSIVLADSTCEEILGFSADVSISAGVSTTYLGDVYSLNTVRAIDIRSNISGSMSFSTSDHSRCSIIARILVDIFGGIIQYEDYGRPFRKVATDMTFITFRLTDQVGQIIDNNGRGFSITLELKRERKALPLTIPALEKPRALALKPPPPRIPQPLEKPET